MAPACLASSYPGTGGELLAQLAAACPLSYYSIMELSCRGGMAYGQAMSLAMTASKLQLAELLVGQGHQQLLPSWSHYKAYTSATASWVKTYAGVLQAVTPTVRVAATGGGEGGGDQGTRAPVRKGMTPDIDVLTQSLKNYQQWLLAEVSQLQRLPIGAGRMFFIWFELDSERSHTPATIQLLLLVWLARAVAVTAKLLLGAVGVCRKKKSSSRKAAGGASRPGSSSSIGTEAGGVGSSRTSGMEGGGVGSSSSSSSGVEGGWVGGSSSDVEGSGVRSSSSLGPDVSSAVQEAGVATGLLALRGIQRPEIGSNGTTETETSARVLSIVLLQYQALVLWHRHACKHAPAAGGVDGSTSATCGSSCGDPPKTAPPAAAAAAAGNCATSNMPPTAAASAVRSCGVASHGTAAAEASTPPEAAPKDCKAATSSTTSSSAPAPGSSAVPSRIAKLPQHGLPSAVVSQLDFINSSWPHKVLSGEQQPAGEQEVEELLQDLLLLGQLFMEEVPSPLGCNNPGCGDLRGLSELTASCKTCTGCGVVKYCSRGCQVGHWKAHKAMCKRLQGQKE